MKTIFVVDDSDVNLIKEKQALEERYRVFTMPSAAKMFFLLEKITPDLILLDIEMPEMDGFTAMEILKQNENTAKIPVIFLTATVDENIEARGFQLGAVDFITKPFSKLALINRIENHLNISDLIRMRTEHIEKLHDGIITVLADLVESRDKTTGGHIERTSAYVKLLVEGMIEKGIYSEELQKMKKIRNIDILYASVRLHDIGKIAISDLILNKPDKLTKEEFEEIKTHVAEGESIIDRIIKQTGDVEFLRYAKLFASYHHERWDGTGYPRGLKGEEIPIQGRIMAIADVYDALVSERPYKKAFPHEEAVKIIMNDSGKQFDPKIVELFCEIEDKFYALIPKQTSGEN
jgi:putative two-component system response regulator